MGKVTNNELAALISSRLTAIMNLTGLSLEGVAKFTGLNAGPLRSHYNKTLTISVEHVAKICQPFAISLSDFFNPEYSLTSDIAIASDLVSFKNKLLLEQQNLLLKNPVEPVDETILGDLKQQREFVDHIVHASDYFTNPKTLEQMVVDFQKQYKAHFTTERLYSLLRKYVGREILQRKPLPRAKCDRPVSRRPFMYFKPEDTASDPLQVYRA